MINDFSASIYSIRLFSIPFQIRKSRRDAAARIGRGALLHQDESEPKPKFFSARRREIEATGIPNAAIDELRTGNSREREREINFLQDCTCSQPSSCIVV